MELWETLIFKKGQCFVLDGGEVVARTPAKDDARRIRDEHNAWVILEQRGWALERWSNGKYGVVRHKMWPVELLHYITTQNEHDTPVAAILAADTWLKEKANGIP